MIIFLAETQEPILDLDGGAVTYHVHTVGAASTVEKAEQMLDARIKNMRARAVSQLRGYAVGGYTFETHGGFCTWQRDVEWDLGATYKTWQVVRAVQLDGD